MLTEALNAISKEPQADEAIQYADVIVRTASLFGVAVVAAAVGWLFLPINGILLLVLSLAAFGVAIGAMRQRTPSAGLPVLYAVLEGVVVGCISEVFAESYGTGLVVTAVVATAIAFAVCLGVFLIPAVRNGSQGRKFFLVAIISYLVLSLVSFVMGMFGVGDGLGFYGLGWLGIGIAVAATLLSAWSLVIDFGSVDAAVKSGCPRPLAWLLSLGLFISTVWLYLNILRLLGMARR